MKPALKLANVLGLDPLRNDNYTQLKKMFCALCIVSLFVSAYLEFFSNFTTFETYETAPESLIPHFQTMFKMYSLIFSRTEIVELIQMAEQFYKFSQCDERKKLTKLYKRVDLFFYVYASLVAAACVLFAIVTLIFKPGKPIFLCYGGLHGLESPEFEIYLVVDLIGIVIISVTVPAFDGLFFYFALYIYTEFKLLKIAFKTMSGQELREAVKHHDFLLKYIKKLNSVYSPIFLYQFFCNLLAICFCLFMLSRSGIPPEMVSFSKYFLCLLAFLVQSYTFCSIGDLITELSEDVSNAIFYTDWLDDEAYENKTARLIIMSRAQNPVMLTIGKFANMNLRTFILIVRNAYSFLAFVNHALN
ncbi:odorant receptor 105 [Tribolium castaneum]|uniref:Odorant receptor n=1 Tax=Tribolium castaneum TaxID=7070 RepID=D6WV53_TRICA|nr:PREDICTED: odorant receptor 94a-like [Tribolium castaneum]EFA09296.1 odorant receptor 105 [Tribolium castaneum]|eukprot:XP_015838474.1 PREDICTED: odorant receptor 94a-like [Tribolium castaneum]